MFSFFGLLNGEYQITDRIIRKFETHDGLVYCDNWQLGCAYHISYLKDQKGLCQNPINDTGEPVVDKENGWDKPPEYKRQYGKCSVINANNDCPHYLRRLPTNCEPG